MRHARRVSGASRRFTAAGKIVLAAIVHHDTIPDPAIDLTDANSKTDLNDATTSPEQESKTVHGRSTKTTGNNNNNSDTHEDDKIFPIPGRRKLSKLFSTKKAKKETTKAAEESQGTRTTQTLIDNGKINENSAPNERVNLLTQPPTKNTQRLNSNEQYHHSPVHHHQHRQYNSHEKYLEQAEQTPTTTSNGHKRKQTGQVIEFKFDLIVDQESQSMWNCTDSQLISSGPEQVKSSRDEMTTSDQVGKAGRVDNLNQSKLDDNVNELVESFVLDSNDVCLMSIGAPEIDLNTKRLGSVGQVASHQRGIDGSIDEFEYLSQLVTHSLAYSFHLLSSADHGRRQQQSAAGDGGEQRPGPTIGNKSGKQQSSSPPDVQLAPNRTNISSEPSSTNANNYSIELSATLFLCAETSDEANTTTCKPINIVTDPTDGAEKPPPTHVGGQEEGRFSIHDLLARDDDSTGIKSTARAYHEASGQWVYDERREVFTNGSVSSSSSTSIDCSTVEEAEAVVESIKVELRRLQLEGSLRTSKKTLIVSLKLKQRINGGLFSNRMCLIDFRPKFYELQPIFESIFNGQALAHLKRQKIHLQALESRRQDHHSINADHGFNSGLSEDESTKQHHQVASLNKLIQAEWLLYKQLSSALIRTLLVVHVHKLVSPTHQVINNNNSTTNTNQTLQRLQEMDRFIEQRMMNDNLILLEFARSLQRASCVKLKRRKRHLKSHLASSELSVATSNVSATTNTNEVITQSSPLRINRQQSSASLARNALSSHANHLSHNRKASLDMSLALSRHHHRHHQQRSMTHNHGNSSRHPAYRCHTLQRQSDLTESSSISTSSGSQRTRAAQRIPRPSQRSSRTHRDHYSYFERDNFCNNLSSLNNLSDSDSVTSANLNSCSSSSYQRLPNTTCQQWPESNPTGGSNRNGVDLKWSTKRHHLRPLKHSMDDGSSPSSPSIELSSLKCPTSGSQSKPRSSSISRCRDTSSSRGGMDELRMASKASSVIQIDCQPARKCLPNLSFNPDTADHVRTSQMMQIDGDDATRMSDKTLGLDDMADNMSDICSVIAEPPKQLKLEEFLNQLSSIIAPITTNSPQARLNGHSQGGGSAGQVSVSERADIVPNGVTNGMMCPDGYDSDAMMSINLKQSNYYSAADTRQRERHLTATNKSNGNGLADEDDEDCKSHSSILEHLSSLALESNTKLNNRQLRLDYQLKSHHQMSDSSSIEQTQLNHHHHEIVLQSPNDCTHTMLGQNNEDVNLSLLQSGQGKSPMGHLQRLLNSSARKVAANSRVTVRDPSSIEDQLRALSISCQATKSTSPSASSGVFISSNESSCSSSSTSAATSSLASDDKISNLGKMKPSLVHSSSSMASQRDLYTRKHHMDVKT